MLRHYAADDIQYRQSRAVMRTTPDDSFSRSRFKYRLDEPSLFEVEIFEFAVDGAGMNRNLAQFRVVDFEKIAVLRAVIQLRGDERTKLFVDSLRFADFPLERRDQRHESEPQRFEVDVLLRTVIQVHRTLGHSGGIRNLVDRSL